MAPIDFQSAVLERSHVVPVLVDFWAPWCGPCRVLGPVLEELAGEAAGRWELVKLDTDEQPEVARAFGIRGIPAVKLFHRGEVSGEFVGAMGREDVRRWLESYLPDDRIERLTSIASRWPERGPELAGELEEFVRQYPDVKQGRMHLAQAIVGRDPRRARELADAGSLGPELAEMAEDINSLADLAESHTTSTDGVAGHVARAREALRAHQLDRALDELVDAAMVDKGFADELPRRAAVALFHLLGQDHELTQKHQRRLAMAIHT